MPNRSRLRRLWVPAKPAVAAAPAIATSAAHFAAASSQYATQSSTPYEIGAAQSLSLVCWVNPDSHSGNNRIVGKWHSSASGSDEWLLQVNAAGTQFEWIVVGVGSAFNILDATEGVSNGAWQFIYCQYTPIINGQGISINNGTLHVMNTSSVVQTIGGEPVALASDADTPAHFFDGALDALGVWSRVLTAGEISSIYNGGAGINFNGVTGSLLTGLISWHDFANGWTDSSGNGHTWTPTNSPTFAAGIS